MGGGGLAWGLDDAAGDGSDDQGEHEVAGQAFEGDEGFAERRDGVDVAEAHGGHHGDAEVDGVEEDVFSRERVEGRRNAGDFGRYQLCCQVEDGEGREHGDVDTDEVARVFPGDSASRAEHAGDAASEFFEVDEDHGHDEEDDGQPPGGEVERGDAEAGEESDDGDFSAFAWAQGFREEVSVFFAEAPCAFELDEECGESGDEAVQDGNDEVGEQAFGGEQVIDERVGAFLDEVQKDGSDEDARDEVGEEEGAEGAVLLLDRGLRHS